MLHPTEAPAPRCNSDHVRRQVLGCRLPLAAAEGSGCTSPPYCKGLNMYREYGSIPSATKTLIFVGSYSKAVCKSYREPTTMMVLVAELKVLLILLQYHIPQVDLKMMLVIIQDTTLLEGSWDEEACLT